MEPITAAVTVSIATVPSFATSFGVIRAISNSVFSAEA